MRRVSSSILLIVFAFISVVGQSQTSQTNSGKSSFDEFRKGLLSDYSKFRNSVLEDYDRFLEAAWEDYQQMRGKDRYETPKPHKAPVLPDEPRKTAPVALPKPEIGKETPESARTPGKSGPASQKTKPVPERKQPVTPVITPPVQPVEAKPHIFSFYGMDTKITDGKSLEMGRQLSSPNDFADQWRSFSADKAERLLPILEEVAATYGLNDYLKFRLLRAFITSRYPHAHVSSRVALEHYLLANMGYDVRLAVDEAGIPLLLMSFNQQIYAVPFLSISGQTYYAFLPDGMEVRPNARLSTCKLPKGVDLGRPMDLRITSLNLPDKPKEFNLTFGGLSLNGKVNENLMNVVYHYPQMATSDFAVSELSPSLRADLVDQLKKQLEGMEEREAVDKLLQFTQNAFEYATDQDFHGFEKPYFLEEILYYPKCDCEDRSIFYTYMLWNVLGVENHLLAYPGHESASVHLSTPIKGDSYEWKGKTFYISDPTYIGAKTGMCMPQFSTVRPDIDYSYCKVK